MNRRISYTLLLLFSMNRATSHVVVVHCVKYLGAIFFLFYNPSPPTFPSQPLHGEPAYVESESERGPWALGGGGAPSGDPRETGARGGAEVEG